MPESFSETLPNPTSPNLENLKVAIVHDWLPVYGGAERVLEQILAVVPQAEIYSMIDDLSDEHRAFLGGRKVNTSLIQNLPLGKKQYRNYLPLMPFAVEQFDLSEYDLVISSSYAVAKGVITGPDQTHVAYVHSPARFAWDQQHAYLKEAGLGYGPKGLLVRLLLHRFRAWDARSGNAPDVLLANSKFIAKRITKIYRRDSQVLYPPVAVDEFKLGNTKGDYFVTASRLVQQKRVDLIVKAFSELPEHKLVVIGEGPEYEKIAKLATPNVTLLGHQPFSELKRHFQEARAFVFASEEDFGIVPLEAQACGTPVIAFGKGGSLETVKGHGEDRTGVYFAEQNAESLKEAIAEFVGVEKDFDPVEIREHALQFSSERFREEFRGVLEAALEEG